MSMVIIFDNEGNEYKYPVNVARELLETGNYHNERPKTETHVVVGGRREGKTTRLKQKLSKTGMGEKIYGSKKES